MKRSRPFSLWILLAVLAFSSCSGPTPEEAIPPSSSYDDLVALFHEWREFLEPNVIDGVPDFSPPAIRGQYAGLQAMKARLAAIDPSRWHVSGRVDYLLLRAEMNGLEFNHKVIRPWSRDPGFYAIFNQFQPTNGGVLRIPSLPLAEEDVDAFRISLRAVPKSLHQARINLTEPAADLALLAMDFKEREGARLASLAEDLAIHHPDLVQDAEAAIAAVDAYSDWLDAGRNDWAPRAGVGVEEYTWFIRNVYYLPYTWEELLAISQRELERAVAHMKLEEHRNRRLPPLEAMEDGDEYIKAYNDSQEFLLEFLKDEEVLTIHESMVLRPREDYRPSPVRDYFAQVQVRDPLPLMPHDFVGHTPDMALKAGDPRPLRGGPRTGAFRTPPFHIDGIRMEATATGMEEILMHLGLLDQRPRSRELTYNLLAFRAARAVADLKMHSNAYSFMDAFDYCVDMTPYGWVPREPENSPTLWGDLDLYLRQPGYGVGYLIGSVQLQQLIADRGRQLGEAFSFKQFYDEFLASGVIPISLIRWEMTGFSDQVDLFWQPAVLTSTAAEEH